MENSKTILLTVSVEQFDYEADDYGNIECQPQSIRVSTIRAVKAVTDLGLREAKEIVDTKFGMKITGRITICFLTDEAGIGRIARLIHDQSELSGGRHSQFAITSIRTIGNGVIMT